MADPGDEKIDKKTPEVSVEKVPDASIPQVVPEAGEVLKSAAATAEAERLAARQLELAWQVIIDAQAASPKVSEQGLGISAEDAARLLGQMQTDGLISPNASTEGNYGIARPMLAASDVVAFVGMVRDEALELANIEAELRERRINPDDPTYAADSKILRYKALKAPAVSPRANPRLSEVPVEQPVVAEVTPPSPDASPASPLDRPGRFTGATSWDELGDLLVDGVTDGAGVKNSGMVTRELIDGVRKGSVEIDNITRTGGLRATVRRLLAAEKPALVSEPAPAEAPLVIQDDLLGAPPASEPLGDDDFEKLFAAVGDDKDLPAEAGSVELPNIFSPSDPTLASSLAEISAAADQADKDLLRVVGALERFKKGDRSSLLGDSEEELQQLIDSARNHAERLSDLERQKKDELRKAGVTPPPPTPLPPSASELIDEPPVPPASAAAEVPPPLPPTPPATPDVPPPLPPAPPEAPAAAGPPPLPPEARLVNVSDTPTPPLRRRANSAGTAGDSFSFTSDLGVAAPAEEFDQPITAGSEESLRVKAAAPPEAKSEFENIDALIDAKTGRLQLPPEVQTKIVENPAFQALLKKLPGVEAVQFGTREGNAWLLSAMERYVTSEYAFAKLRDLYRDEIGKRLGVALEPSDFGPLREGLLARVARSPEDVAGFLGQIRKLETSESERVELERQLDESAKRDGTVADLEIQLAARQLEQKDIATEVEDFEARLSPLVQRERYLAEGIRANKKEAEILPFGLQEFSDLSKRPDEPGIKGKIIGAALRGVGRTIDAVNAVGKLKATIGDRGLTLRDVSEGAADRLGDLNLMRWSQYNSREQSTAQQYLGKMYGRPVKLSEFDTLKAENDAELARLRDDPAFKGADDRLAGARAEIGELTKKIKSLKDAEATKQNLAANTEVVRALVLTEISAFRIIAEQAAKDFDIELVAGAIAVKGADGKMSPEDAQRLSASERVAELIGNETAFAAGWVDKMRGAFKTETEKSIAVDLLSKEGAKLRVEFVAIKQLADKIKAAQAEVDVANQGTDATVKEKAVGKLADLEAQHNEQAARGVGNQGQITEKLILVAAAIMQLGGLREAAKEKPKQSANPDSKVTEEARRALEPSVAKSSELMNNIMRRELGRLTGLKSLKVVDALAIEDVFRQALNTKRASYRIIGNDEMFQRIAGQEASMRSLFDEVREIPSKVASAKALGKPLTQDAEIVPRGFVDRANDLLKSFIE